MTLVGDFSLTAQYFDFNNCLTEYSYSRSVCDNCIHIYTGNHSLDLILHDLSTTAMIATPSQLS